MFNFVSSGIIIVDADTSKFNIQSFNCEKMFVNSEIELFDLFVTIFRKWDPDILVGYEVNKNIFPCEHILTT